MDDKNLRMVCLALAVEHLDGEYSQLIEAADAFFNFIDSHTLPDIEE